MNTEFLIGFHALAACLACWRLTELITMDRITAGVRLRYPWYVLSCGRCVSVWTAGLVTGVLFLSPWLNWPLAISWTWIWLRAIQATSPQTHIPKEASTMALTDKEWERIVNKQANQLASLQANLTVMSVQLETAQERIAELEKAASVAANGKPDDASLHRALSVVPSES